MKKFIALALAAAMATSLVACGGSSAPAASSAAPAESAPAAEAAGEYDALEPVELILADKAPMEVAKKAVPFIIAFLIALLMITYIPAISTFLPSL